jgi:hypothetical protein
MSLFFFVFPHHLPRHKNEEIMRSSGNRGNSGKGGDKKHRRSAAIKLYAIGGSVICNLSTA